MNFSRRMRGCDAVIPRGKEQIFFGKKRLISLPQEQRTRAFNRLNGWVKRPVDRSTSRSVLHPPSFRYRCHNERHLLGSNQCHATFMACIFGLRSIDYLPVFGRLTMDNQSTTVCCFSCTYGEFVIERITVYSVNQIPLKNMQISIFSDSFVLSLIVDY